MFFKKPNPKKNCFQNYGDHLGHHVHQAKQIWHDVHGPNTFSVLAKESWKRIKVFQALRDGHDWVDELGGAIFGTTLATLAAFATLALAIWEACVGLTMRMGMIKNDGGSHFQKAGKNLLCSIAAYVLSVVIYIKSAVSLITRPLVTLITGYKPQDIERFSDNSKHARVSRNEERLSENPNHHTHPSEQPALFN